MLCHPFYLTLTAGFSELAPIFVPSHKEGVCTPLYSSQNSPIFQTSEKARKKSTNPKAQSLQSQYFQVHRQGLEPWTP